MMRINTLVSYVFKVKPIVFAEGLNIESEMKGFWPEQLER